jgi:peptidoglycan/LPS O-acetylase OafA/YrhL
LTDFAVRSPSQAIQPAQDTGKILGIELLRFTSALAVLIFHYQHFTFVGASPVDLIRTQQPFYPVLGFFYRYGFYGVEVFWCISGFIFFWKYAREIAGRTLAGYTFFILRVSRLYPLHLATLLFVAVMQWVYRSKNGAFFVYQVNDLQHFVLQLFMASNWGPETAESFNGPIWSISIEVLVYAIFFMSLRYLSSSAIFITLVAVGAGLIQLLKLSENPLFTCLMYFYLGCLTALVYERVRQRRTARRLASALALLSIIALAVLSHFVSVSAKQLLVVFSPALIFLCVTHIPAGKTNARLLVPAGNITYSSYLLHVPIQLTVVTFCGFAGFRIPFYNPAFFMVYLIGTLALSHFTYEKFEAPLQSLIRRRLLRRKSTAVPKAQPQDA